MPSGTNKRSICSCGARVDFYWFACAGPDHVKEAVDALMHAIESPPNRLKHPYRSAMTRQEFVSRLTLAQAGELRPIDHVKSIEDYPTIDMFEIRWSGLTVQEKDDSGATRFLTVEARLLYVDLPTGLRVLGLHAHEKEKLATKRQTRDAQNAQIEVAVTRYGGVKDWPFPPV
jgi:hypothetical protein